MSVESLIKITLNGKPTEIKPGMTVSDLLAKWKMKPELVTVEINEEILQKLEYDTTEIKNGDQVEFVFYMGGGAARVLPPAGLYFLQGESLEENRGLPFGVTRAALLFMQNPDGGLDERI